MSPNFLGRNYLLLCLAHVVLIYVGYVRPNLFYSLFYIEENIQKGASSRGSLIESQVQEESGI